MNLILFNTPEEAIFLPTEDPRTHHIREILRLGKGDLLYVGLLNGPRGQARIKREHVEGLELDIQWENNESPSLFPLHLLIATPRPQSARKVLQEATSMGVASLSFYQAEKAEASYAQSRLWHTDEWKRYLRLGAEQAFTTRVPEVRHYGKLRDALATSFQGTRLALDLYEAICSLGKAPLGNSALLVLGGERGFSVREREHLRENAFTLCHLGERVLRTETAAIAASTLLLHRWGIF